MNEVLFFVFKGIFPKGESSLSVFLSLSHFCTQVTLCLKVPVPLRTVSTPQNGQGLIPGVTSCLLPQLVFFLQSLERNVASAHFKLDHQLFVS